MYLDCLILKPIDDRYFNFDAKISLSRESWHNNNSYASGMIVFKEDVKEMYQKRFITNPNNYNTNICTYGQKIWSDINKEVGSELPLEYHCLLRHITEGAPIKNIRTLHLHGGSMGTTLKLCKLICNKI